MAQVISFYGTPASAGRLRRERDCSYSEYLVRRAFTGLLYWRLYRRLHPGHPYYTPRAIRALARILRPESLVFEWGSGASTLWYANRVERLCTIEHDPGWYQHTAMRLEGRGTCNVTLLLRRPELESWADYREAIDGFPDGHFDLIAIDGRDRVACVERALPKLKVGGSLLLDDSHRSRYRAAFEILRGHPSRRFDFGILQTTIFRKCGPERGRTC